MNLSAFISKIPKSVLVVGVLAIALGLFIMNDPLKDECEVRTGIFLKEMRGILTSVRSKEKTQFAQISFWMDRCRQGNSVGACDDYFTGLRKLASALKLFPEKCQAKFSEENEGLLKNIVKGIEVMALVAWGDAPPAGVSNRSGWLTEADLKTFCQLKKTYLELAGEENLAGLKNYIFSSYPDAWPEKVPIESRAPENRPHALKTKDNPTGTMDTNQIYERSLFSIRCDLYE